MVNWHNMQTMGEGAQANYSRVVIGLIYNEHRQILLSKRLAGKHLAGYWEFPGGKIDSGETAEQALLRELKEELTITVKDYSHLKQFSYSYPQKNILFDVFQISNYQGEAQGNEGQEIIWTPVKQLSQFKLPPANQEILALLEGVSKADIPIRK